MQRSSLVYAFTVFLLFLRQALVEAHSRLCCVSLVACEKGTARESGSFVGERHPGIHADRFMLSGILKRGGGRSSSDRLSRHTAS